MFFDSSVLSHWSASDFVGVHLEIDGVKSSGVYSVTDCSLAFVYLHVCVFF